MKNYRPHILAFVALAIIVSCGWHGMLRNALVDLRFAWQAREASGEIVIVAIDAPSIEKIGVWPWPRQIHADLLRKLQSAGTQDVAFDVDFSTPSGVSSDRDFAAALDGAGGSVLLPYFQQPGADKSSIHVNRPLSEFSDRSWPALVNVEVGSDGLVRRYPFGGKLDGKFLPSMGAALAGQYAEKRTPFLIDFSIRSSSVPMVSYIDVLRGEQATLEKLKGKKLIVGGTALELGDRFSIPNGAVVSGPLLQTLAAESILQGRALQGTSDIVTFLMLAGLAVLMLVSWRPFSAIVRVVLLIGLGAFVEGAAIVLQSHLPLVIDTSLFQAAVVVYLGTIALDEIDFRGLLSRIAENRFQKIAMSLGDGLICTDADHRITIWNPGAVAVFGYRPDEMIGKPLDVLYAGKHDSAVDRFALGASSSVAGILEFDGRRKNGEIFPVEARFSRWEGTDGFQFGAIMRDISVRKREAERIRYLAEYDSLTGLANRNTLHAVLAGMTAKAETAGYELTLLVLGLDRFAQINDMLGHASGDLVLKAVAQRLRTVVPDAATVARLGGDEFAIAVPVSDLRGSVDCFAERIKNAFDAPLLAGTREYQIHISIGAAVFPTDGRTAEEILSNGHLALSRAKAMGQDSHVLFDESIRQELETRLRLEAELIIAVEQNQFELFYQPQINLADNSVVGAEALIRWHHPIRGLVSPAEFMPVVHSSPISGRVAGWVLETACAQAAAWERGGHKVRVGINLSPSQLQSGDLANVVAQALAKNCLSPTSIELEVTEDILLNDEQKVLDTFRRIQNLGVRIVFDDFGTGYGSLSYLKKFPLDGLKIDRSFVSNLLTNPDDLAIVGSTISLSKQLELSVIAEGIEDRPTADLLASMGCHEGQGYYFGRPMPASEFEEENLISGFAEKVA